MYRLVTKNMYEAQMFERVSRKLGLGQAILKSVEHGVKKSDVKDLTQLDNMLRHGAYAILHNDDEAAKRWKESDIDELHAARRAVGGGRGVSAAHEHEERVRVCAVDGSMAAPTQHLGQCSTSIIVGAGIRVTPVRSSKRYDDLAQASANNVSEEEAPL